MSKFDFTTSGHSRNTAYRRTQDWTKSIRTAGFTDYQIECVGIRVSEKVNLLNYSSCPLLNLVPQYKERLKKTNDAPGLASYRKNGYHLKLVEPDRLTSGLFQGVLTITFIQLQTDKVRDQLQILLNSALSTYGFQSQSILYKPKQKTLVPGLNMSTLYCTLTFLPTCLMALNALESPPSKTLVLNLNRFFQQRSGAPLPTTTAQRHGTSYMAVV